MFMKKSFSKAPAMTMATLSLISMLAIAFDVHADRKYAVQAEFTGTPDLNNPNPDSFGATVSIPNNMLAVVGAPGSTPNGQIEAGAVYYFGRHGNTWSPSQTPYTNPVAGNLVSDVVIAARDQWLFVPANGTPLDSPAKDYSGAILVFQLDKNNQYQLVQTILNPDGTMPFNFFGFNLSYNGGDWMVAGGVNVYKAYFFKLNSSTNQWEFKQSVSVVGDTMTTGYVFPCIFGTHAVISQVIPRIPNMQSNGSAFAYEFDGTQWNYIQTLTGINSIMSPKYAIYDAYGEFIAGSGDTLMISAPQDTNEDNGVVGPDIAGAVYFYTFQNGLWQLNSKVFSSQPSTLFGFGLAIDNNVAVIGDCGRTVNGNIFQGALQVYTRQGSRWTPSSLLIDPNGRAYDFFGGGGVDCNANFVFGGTDTISTDYIPGNFPGVGNNPFNNGRAVLYK